MKTFGLPECISLIAMGIGCLSLPAQAYEGARANSVLLNGQWEFAKGAGDEQAETAAGQQRLDWQPVTLPGPFMKWNQQAATQIKFVWARRNFDVTPTQATSLAVLRWDRIASGAAAFINGQKVGENEPTGPFQVIVPARVLRPGENQIVLRIPGAAGMRTIFIPAADDPRSLPWQARQWSGDSPSCRPTRRAQWPGPARRL